MTPGLKTVAARTTEPTVAAAFARGLVDFAQTKGVSTDTLTAHAQINASQLHDGEERIPFTKYVALMRAVKTLCGDPAFALHFGESEYAETGIGCLIGGFAETGADAFALTNRYARLNADVECAGA